jgi:ribosomal-protein-alanine N-acetyltransferase
MRCGEPAPRSRPVPRYLRPPHRPRQLRRLAELWVVRRRCARLWMEIQTNRFLLRDFSATDAAAFLAYHGDPRNSEFNAGRSETRTRSAFAGDISGVGRPETSPELPVRCCSASGTSRARRLRRVASHGTSSGRSRIRDGLVPDFRGRYAYAVEIGRALLDFGFGKIGLRVITGSTVRANSAITRLTEWFGAEIVATRLASEQMPNREWASLDWRLTLEQWHYSTSRSNDRDA